MNASAYLILTACLSGLLRAELPPGHESLAKKVASHHAALIFATYSDALTGARQLQSAVRSFLAAPSAAGLTAARAAWSAARQPYLYTEAFRYYAGPIDDADGPEPLLNSWPLDEAIIDVIPDSPVTPIIADEKRYPNLTGEVIESLNQQEGEKGITCGYHAVEFLLWGQDLSATGPGDRPWTDYTTAPFAARRGQYLQACCALIISHLEELAAEWAPGKLGNFRAVFEEDYAGSILDRIFYGLVFLTGTELAGERLQVAWDTREQEDEHSCFSDTTQLDHVHDAEGVLHVWTGEYTRPGGTVMQGPGLRALAMELQPDRTKKLDSLIAGMIAAARAIPAPFDQAIAGEDTSPGRVAVLHFMTLLGETSTALRELARAMGTEIPAEAPDEIEG